jgi:hypothetical protein
MTPVSISLTRDQIASIRALLAQLPADDVPGDIVPPVSPDPEPSPRLDPAPLPRGKYRCRFLGVDFAASARADVFGRVVDMTHEIAPEVLERLAQHGTTASRYISRDRSGIHLRTPYLPVSRTASGWWISRNISGPQLVGALKALCAEAGLTYGKDLVID